MPVRFGKKLSFVPRSALHNAAHNVSFSGVTRSLVPSVASSPPRRKLARIIYGMIKSGQPYTEAEAFKVTPTTQAKRLLNLQKQAQSLGYQLIAA